MSVSHIRPGITPIADALRELSERAHEIEGLVILVSKKDDDYDYFVAGSVAAERTIGRLEVMKAEFLRKIFK